MNKRRRERARGVPLFFFPFFGIKLEACALRKRSTQQRTHPRRQTSPNHTEHTSLSPSPTKLVPVGGCPLFEELPHDASTQVRCPADVHTLCLKLDRTQDSLRKSCVLPRVALGCLCCTPIRATRRRLFAQMRSERNGRLSQAAPSLPSRSENSCLM